MPGLFEPFQAILEPNIPEQTSFFWELIVWQCMEDSRSTSQVLYIYVGTCNLNNKKLEVIEEDTIEYGKISFGPSVHFVFLFWWIFLDEA